ncbi:T9SS type A sorting domain-containing protein [Winogradskyella eckloniae]|uniref:T9SS type A sorting domain-containing protein n=1 Tax=Winogradskyella eckloniae TaxID=1089306 RepID=UPI001566FD5C|nr:T9SS type A sorting domain-containing protein [Winogradskyella eckloniae]NRD20790.1 T9SS type A sorting domain-containing protein [Winogradskyella eckloniae]
MTKKYALFTLMLLCLFFMPSAFSQQDVFSRSDVSTGNFGDGQLPWYYATDNNSQGDPDSGNSTRNYVKIGHNNNTTMYTNGRYYMVASLDFQASATSPRTINNSGGGLSASGGIYNATSATHVFNTPIGIDGTTVQLHTNASGGLTFTETIYINNNTVEFGNMGSGSITVSGVMVGTGNLTKVGTNTLIITGSNTYSGTTTINEGVVILSGDLSNSDVTVKSGATLELDGTSTVKSITVEAGGYIQVNSGATLTVTDTLMLQSISNLYASLISDGTIVGTVKYKRYVNAAAGTSATTGSNDLVSAPLSGSSFGVLRNDVDTNILSGTVGTTTTFYLFGPFNPSTNTYDLYSAADDAEILVAGNGYRTGSDGGGTYTFTGNVETNSISKNIVTPTGASASIWNLIGNPYPSYLKLKEFLLANNGQFDSGSSGVYGYDGAAHDGWITWNLAYALDPVNAGAVIAPGQGFFVASKSGGGIVTFDPSYRTTGNSDDFISGRSTNAVTNLELTLSNATSSFVTDFYFTEYSTQGLDPGFDSSLFGGSAPDFSIYSELLMDNTNISMSIQALGETDYANVTIPLGVNAVQGEQITFSISANTLPNTVEVYLDDTEASTSTLLNTSDYIITPTDNLNGVGRFYLRTTDSALSVIDNEQQNTVTIYNNKADKTLGIQGTLLEQTTVHIYDIQGRLVHTALLEIQDRSQHIDVSSLTNGIYVISLRNRAQNINQKVLIQH